MNSPKKFIVFLALGNAILLAIILLLLGGNSKNAASGTSKEVIVSSLVAELRQKAREAGSFGQPNWVVFFLHDSANTRINVLLGQIDSSVAKLDENKYGIMFIGNNLENCLPRGSSRTKCVIIKDENDRIRHKYAIPINATLLVESDKQRVKSFYPYVINGYVLCEQLAQTVK